MLKKLGFWSQWNNTSTPSQNCERQDLLSNHMLLIYNKRLLQVDIYCKLPQRRGDFFSISSSTFETNGETGDQVLFKPEIALGTVKP